MHTQWIIFLLGPLKGYAIDKMGKLKDTYLDIDVCLCGVLRPSQPVGFMSSAVSLPNHTFTRQA